MKDVKFITQLDHRSKTNASSKKEPHTRILTFVNLRSVIFAQKPVILTKFKLRNIYSHHTPLLYQKFHSQIKNYMAYFNSC